MANYGGILTFSPASVASGSQLTLMAPVGGPFQFLPGRTYVTFRLLTTAQITVVPAGITHHGDFEISLAFPQLGAGTYPCMVTSGADVAETVGPVAGGGSTVAAAGPSTGTMLSAPVPPIATPGDTITISAPPAGPFVFDPATTYVVFSGGGILGGLGQVTVLPAGVTVTNPKQIRLAVPSLPVGAYTVRVTSRGVTAMCNGQLAVRARAASGPPTTMAGAPPTGAVPSSAILLSVPATTGSVAPTLAFGPGLPPIFVHRAPPPRPPSILSLFLALVRRVILLFSPGSSSPSSPSSPPPGPTPPTPPPTPPPPPPPTPPGSPATAAPPNYDTDNQVEYLIDGVTVFQRAADLMDRVAALPASDGGYVHMSFWMCDESTVINAAGATFISKVQALGNAGKEVKLLLWHPVGPGGIVVNGVKAANERCKQNIDALALPSVEVKLLPHPLAFGSYHEKIMIFQIGEIVTTIVGGLNVHSNYRDTAPHPNAFPWHDAAVQVTGPATVMIETHWDTNWALTNGAAPQGPSFVGAMGNQSVFVGETDGPTNVKTIQAELIARIQAANDYVYMENYGIFDPDVITALAQKVRAKFEAGQPFAALLVVPDLSLGGDYNWLHFVTYVHLSFMRCTAFTYDDGGVIKTVRRAADGLNTWQFNYAGGVFGIGNWYEDSTVRWDTNSTEIKNIRSFTNDTPLYTVLRCDNAAVPNGVTAVYIHDKLGMADDAFSWVGSANFTPRSMVQDGELTCFIAGNGVPALRTTLWAEYFAGGAPAPAGFLGAATANAAARAAGTLAPGRCYAVPLNLFPPPAIPGGPDTWVGAENH